MGEGCKKILRGINKTFEVKITNTYVFIYRNFLCYLLFLSLIFLILFPIAYFYFQCSLLRIPVLDTFHLKFLLSILASCYFYYILNVSAYNISLHKQYLIMRTINFHLHPA